MKSYKVIETRSVFTHRYLVEADVVITDEEVLNLIHSGELDEIMQRHEGETISSVTVMTEDDVLQLDNSYLFDYSRESQLNLIRRLSLKNN